MIDRFNEVNSLSPVAILVNINLLQYCRRATRFDYVHTCCLDNGMQCLAHYPIDFTLLPSINFINLPKIASIVKS